MIKATLQLCCFRCSVFVSIPIAVIYTSLESEHKYVNVPTLSKYDFEWFDLTWTWKK